MIPALTEPGELVALGGFLGAQLMVLVFSLLIARAYRERALVFHAGSVGLAVIAVLHLASDRHATAQLLALLVLAGASLHLLEVVSHAGAMRRLRYSLLAVSLGGVPALALLSLAWPGLAGVALAAWVAVVVLAGRRALPQSRPWGGFVTGGLVALVLAVLVVAADSRRAVEAPAVLVAGLFCFWSGAVYLATVWRSRIFGETRTRVNARTTIDPLTGLSTPLVLEERIHAARTLTRRYGHQSVVMLVAVENLDDIGREFGPEGTETAVLAAASRVREALRRDGDVAARLSHARIGVLAEGVASAEAAATVSTRILVAGLKEPIPGLATEFLRFRIVQATLPAEELSPKLLLRRLGARLDQELAGRSERRIVTLAQDELLGSRPNDNDDNP